MKKKIEIIHRRKWLQKLMQKKAQRNNDNGFIAYNITSNFVGS